MLAGNDALARNGYAPGMHHSSGGPPPECEELWQTRPLSSLIAHVSSVYHHHIRRELPPLWQSVVAELDVGAWDARPGLTTLASLITELRDQLETHSWTEEDLLFPNLIALEHPTVLRHGLTRESLTQLLDRLQRKHTAVRRVMAHIDDTLTALRSAAVRHPGVAAIRIGVAQVCDRLIELLDLEERCVFPRARTLAATIRT